MIMASKVNDIRVKFEIDAKTNTAIVDLAEFNQLMDEVAELQAKLLSKSCECEAVRNTFADMVFRCADNGIAIDDIFEKHGITLE